MPSPAERTSDAHTSFTYSSSLLKALHYHQAMVNRGHVSRRSVMSRLRGPSSLINNKVIQDTHAQKQL